LDENILHKDPQQDSITVCALTIYCLDYGRYCA
jgi:hypothetical protein